MGNRIRLPIDGILSYTAAKTLNLEVQHFLSCMSARIRNHANSDTVSVMKTVLMRNRSAVTTRLLNNPALSAGCDTVWPCWLQLTTRNRDKQRFFFSLRVLQNAENFLHSWRTNSFSRRTMLKGVSHEVPATASVRRDHSKSRGNLGSRLTISNTCGQASPSLNVFAFSRYFYSSFQT